MYKYLSGSEWSRWDLHIHTPETLKNDQFKGSSPEEKWDNFYKSISDYVDKSLNEIKVIGITDYLSVENYHKVVENKERLPKSIEMILPNVELRMLPMSKEHGINIHFIFNPKIIGELESSFFSQLKMKADNQVYYGTKFSLIELGKSKEKNLSNNEAYKKGVESFIPEFSDITSIFEENLKLRENTIILVSNGSKDGVSGAKDLYEKFSTNEKDNFSKKRDSIYQFVDGIFSANENDKKHFLGENEDVEKRYGELKPCLHGSDAHSNDRIFEPNEKKYCWIKANPTFNGLKQVIWEPKERVKIGESIPEQKEKYNTIEKVRFIPKENTKKFSDDWIYLNSNLNTIIGGKSSGKSLLLYLIAKTTQNNGNFQDNIQYDLDNLSLDNFEVVWSNGRSDKFHNKEKIGILTYIPQFHLNNLVEQKSKENELNELIEKTLLNNDELKLKYLDFENKIKEKEKEKELLKLEIIKILDEKSQIKEKMLEYQEKIILEKSVSEKKMEIDKIKKDIGITDEQMLEEENLKWELEKIKAFKDREIIDSLKVNINTKFKEIILNFENDFRYFNNPEFDATLKEEIKKDGEETLKNLEKDIRSLNVKFNKDIESIRIKVNEVEDLRNQKKEEIIKKLEPMSKRMEEQKILIEKEKILKQETDKLLNRKKLDEKFQLIEEEILKNLNKVLEALKQEKIIYENLLEDISKLNKEELIDGLDINLKFTFDNYKYSEYIENILNMANKQDNLELYNYLCEKEKKKIEFKNFDDIIFQHYKNLILLDNDDIKFKKNKEKKDLIELLLKNYIKKKYDIIKNGDSLSTMSPGKRGLILLQLFLSIATKDYPILVDQPEDNLDNRTVYNELKEIITMKKKKRQIIITTHNANLVVSADAEEVIVANQEGENNGKDNKEFQFEYVTGALENSFTDESQIGILYKKGIKEHVCEILEGGEEAFKKRKKKYQIK